MERPRPSGVAWSALALGILAYEVLAEDDELLTDQSWRSIDSQNKLRQVSTYFTIGATALHLLRLLPKSVDPYHYIGKVIRR